MTAPAGDTRDDGTRRRGVDEHRLTEFIYGTVTALVALAGIEHEGHEPAWWRAAAIVIVGAAAVWFAHGYSAYLAKRVAEGRAPQRHEMSHALASSWPIVSAGFLLSLPLPLAGLGLCSLPRAIAVSRALGIFVLGLLGFLASNQRPSRRLILAALSAGLGLAVVAAEIAVHGLRD